MYNKYDISPLKIIFKSLEKTWIICYLIAHFWSFLWSMNSLIENGAYFETKPKK